MLSDVEANLCVLALAAARNIVQREIEIDPTILRDLVVRGLAAIKPDSPIEVRLHPTDLEAVQPLLDESSRSADAEVHWVADPALERGGFFLDGPRRLVDGRLDEALRHLYQRMIYE
jgi:flagellar assembly protein FliH